MENCKLKRPKRVKREVLAKSGKNTICQHKECMSESQMACHQECKVTDK